MCSGQHLTLRLGAQKPSMLLNILVLAVEHIVAQKPNTMDSNLPKFRTRLFFYDRLFCSGLHTVCSQLLMYTHLVTASLLSAIVKCCSTRLLTLRAETESRLSSCSGPSLASCPVSDLFSKVEWPILMRMRRQDLYSRN